MIGCYDFCGHYDWTFAWLEKRGGKPLLEKYWTQTIARDSQSHALELIRKKGFHGMAEYWGHTLEEEGAGFHSHFGEDFFRIDMTRCPSRGFLLENNIGWSCDYCDHCMGWIGEVMEEAGFVVDHEHNHQGQCWWEFRRKNDPNPASPEGAVNASQDVRSQPGWDKGIHHLFAKATSVTERREPEQAERPETSE